MKKREKHKDKPAMKVVHKKKGKQDFALWTVVIIANLIATFLLVKSIIG